jgi:hypothetical protein
VLQSATKTSSWLKQTPIQRVNCLSHNMAPPAVRMSQTTPQGQELTNISSDTIASPLPTWSSPSALPKQICKAAFSPRPKHSNPSRNHATTTSYQLTSVPATTSPTSIRISIRANPTLLFRKAKSKHSAAKCRHFATTLEPRTRPPPSSEPRRCRRRRFI